METANPLLLAHFASPVHFWKPMEYVFWSERKKSNACFLDTCTWLCKNIISSGHLFSINVQCTCQVKMTSKTLMTCITSHHGQTMLVDWPLFWALYRLQDYWHLLTVARTYRKYKVPLIQNLKWVSIQLLMVTRAGTYWQHTGASKPRTSAPINLKH